MKHIALVAFIGFISSSSIGCAGSFEEARAPKRVAAAPPPSEHCISLDATQRDWGGVAMGSAVLAGGSGLATIPVENKDAKIGLAIGAATAAGTAALAKAISSGAATSWARECSTP